MNKAVLYRKEKHDFVMDLRLKQQIDGLRMQLGLPTKFRQVTKYGEETFGVIRVRFSSESFLASQNALETIADALLIDPSELIDTSHSCASSNDCSRTKRPF
jgi:hypothetical protein